MALAPVGGGPGAQPGSYTVVGQRPDSLVGVDGTVVDAETIQATDDTFGVWFQVTVPTTVYAAGEQQAAAGGGTPGLATGAQVVIANYAAFINSLGEMDEVTDMFYLQGISSRGLFIDQLVVEVGTPDLTQTAEVVVKLDPNNLAAAKAQVTSRYATLEAVAASS